VVVFRFVTDDSIEEKVIERAASKLRLDQLVIQQGRIAQQNKAMTKNDLVGMIKHGAESILKGSGAIKLNETIEEVIRKGEERTKKLEQKFQTLGLDELQRFSLDSANMYEFEGMYKRR
jgi:SWI/SNF-related matrix-associated actin-dependent regulator of chromatin subfamily A member 5